MGLDGDRYVKPKPGVPVALMAFDVLHLDNAALLRDPYERRRELLENLELEGSTWCTPPCSIGGGAAMLQASKEQAFEGIVAKRLGSRYDPVSGPVRGPRSMWSRKT